jgi:hypothetical protein
MKIKKGPRNLWQLTVILLFALGCSDLNLSDENLKNSSDDLLSRSRAGLSQQALDSTMHAEKEVKSKIKNSKEEPLATALATSANLARQASVSAQSTYPGYSVTKINDGSRNTTVGPSYSWANNYPDGTRLPQSVYLTFGSPQNVNRIDIYTSSGYALQNYTIQYRAYSGGPWVSLLSVTGNTSVSRVHNFSQTFMIQVQIICQLGPAVQPIYGRLNEVEIYGPASPTLPYISNENGILVFNSENDVTQALDYLEYKYDEYSDAFAAQYAGLDTEQFADQEESVGFNDQQPFIDFENAYGINSLRAVISSQEAYWLSTTDGEDSSADPDEQYMDEDELRTLVNSDGYLKVGTLYYVFLSDDSYYTYDGGGGGCQSPCPVQQQLSAIKKLKSSDALPNGVTFHKSNPTTYVAVSDCRRHQKSKDKITSGSWRMKWKVKVHDGPFAGPGKVKAITKSYRKKWGVWTHKAAYISAQVYGNTVGQDCSGGTYVEGDDIYKRKRRVQSSRSVTNLAVLKDELHGIHYHEKVTSYGSTLTW